MKGCKPPGRTEISGPMVSFIGSAATATRELQAAPPKARPASKQFGYRKGIMYFPVWSFSLDFDRDDEHPGKIVLVRRGLLRVPVVDDQQAIGRHFNHAGI